MEELTTARQRARASDPPGLLRAWEAVGCGDGFQHPFSTEVSVSGGDALSLLPSSAHGVRVNDAGGESMACEVCGEGEAGVDGGGAAAAARIRLTERTVSLVADAPPASEELLSTPADVALYARGLRLHEADRERFVALHLNARNSVVAHETVSIGSVSAALVHPREVFKAAILANAAAVVLLHNHPSGDITPSKEDIELTRRMVEAGRLLGIDVLDHLIIGGSEFLSLKERGLM